ncbi:hypothetical protein CMI37_05905 [Candidatus Pacearchaeota archaeon]|jgi:filamentous hemagglutinin family protein|nr:hypothetical protein [Candidatus Pacearchaeota archaeon]|tara:strand:- start:3748 stop:3975 length:228 start_codon:yes stop_codon:yes gene_type:complete
MRKKKKIITNSKEIYKKLNMLNFSSEVILKNVKPTQISKILSNINSRGDIIVAEKVGNYILLERVGPINFNVYLK